MYTEKEARNRWCPFARTVERWDHGSTSTRNRVVDMRDGKNTTGASPGITKASGLLGCQCVASECMSWRWVDSIQTVWVRDKKEVQMGDGRVRKYKGELWLYECDSVDLDGPFISLYRNTTKTQTRGHCGLAGKP